MACIRELAIFEDGELEDLIDQINNDSDSVHEDYSYGYFGALTNDSEANGTVVALSDNSGKAASSDLGIVQVFFCCVSIHAAFHIYIYIK